MKKYDPRYASDTLLDLACDIENLIIRYLSIETPPDKIMWQLKRYGLKKNKKLYTTLRNQDSRIRRLYISKIGG